MKPRPEIRLISYSGDVQSLGYCDRSPEKMAQALRRAATAYLGRSAKCNYATLEATGPDGWRITIA